MKHTDTPWVYHSGMVWKPDKTGTYDTPIAKMDRDTPRTVPTERDANAEFIVQACNAHDELVEALQTVVLHLGCELKEPYGVQVLAALAKAKGESK